MARPTKKSRTRKHTKTYRCPECGTVWGVRPDEAVECPKCDWAVDKKMRKQKKIRENEFEVTTDDENKVDGQVSKTVKAPDANTAIQKAGQGNQDINQAETLTVKKAGMGGPQTTPRTPPQRTGQPAGTSGMQGLTETYESTKFKYDYTIGLPGGFREFMQKTKGRTKGLVVEQRDGRVYMTVESPDAMDKLMGKLKKASRSRTVETRDKARTLIRGILESVK